MGSTLDRPDAFAFDIAVGDIATQNPRHKLTKIDIVKDGGAIASTHQIEPAAFSVRWKTTLTDGTNKYFFVRVWNADGGDAPGAKPGSPIAWLAPVWTGR